MIKSKFLTTFQKKIDKLDSHILRSYLLSLIEENKHLKTVFNSMKEAVLVFDENSKLIFYNKIAAKILEISIKNPIDMHIKKIISNKLLVEIIQNFIKKEDSVDDYEFFWDSNNPKYISFSLQPLVNEGKVIGNIIILCDVTKEKEDKNKLRQAESLAALTSISAGIAHEIKNPLGAIGIHIQLLESELNNYDDYKSNDNITYSLDVVKEEIERLNNIIVDYLMTVRPLKADLMITNFKLFLDKFIDFIAPEIEENNIILKKSYSNLPDVWLDEKYFKQALLNLVKNAIASTAKDGIIEIEAYEENNYLILNVIDNGMGIPEEIQPKIFNPYFTTKNFGTGLGLTIVYKIVKEHRGDISFSSKKNKTCFSIKLPLSNIKDGLIEYSGVPN